MINLDIEKVVESIYELTSIRTEATILEYNGRVNFISIESKSTDAIVLSVCNAGYAVEILPAESCNQDIAVYEHISLEEACAMFEALHFYRDHCVKPYINELDSMV